MKELQHIINKYNLTLQPDTDHRMNCQRMPIEIHGLNRAGLATLFYELGYKVGAEIGVESGAYSETLLKANPDLKLYSIDAWKSYKNYRDHVTQSKIDGFYETAKARLAGYNSEIIRAYSTDAAKDFGAGSLDFVYIDANHSFEYVVQDLATWGPKVRPGGCIAGHDFFNSKNTPHHVPHAVHGFTGAYRIMPWFVIRGDHSPSFFWIKS